MANQYGRSLAITHCSHTPYVQNAADSWREKDERYLDKRKISNLIRNGY